MIEPLPLRIGGLRAFKGLWGLQRHGAYAVPMEAGGLNGQFCQVRVETPAFSVDEADTVKVSA
jgi:hypothetical protein